MGVEIKGDVDPSVYRYTKDPALPYGVSVIKRHQIKYTVPQMVRFGMLPYSALAEYEEAKAKAEAEKEALLAEEANAKALEAESVDENESITACDDSDKPQAASHGHTFWEDDDGEREMLSEEDFAKFLAENSIDIGNILR